MFVRVRVFFCFYFEGFGRHIEEEDGVFDSYMGRMKPGDFVVDVIRWDPQQSGGGSLIYSRTRKEFPAFAEDVRFKLVEGDFVLQQARRSGK